MKTVEDLLQELSRFQEDTFATFQRRLISTQSKILGVKMANLKAMAKRLLPNAKEWIEKIKSLEYLELDFLKGLLISYQKLELDLKLKQLKLFSEEIDNWAVCDTVVCSTRFKEKELEEVYKFIIELLQSKEIFVKRFGVVLLLKYFAGQKEENIFKVLYSMVYGEYYFDMAVAWYYSVTLTKNFEGTLPYILKIRDKSEFVYQKSLQKGIESYRLTDLQKQKLRLLKKEKKEVLNVKF